MKIWRAKSAVFTFTRLFLYVTHFSFTLIFYQGIISIQGLIVAHFFPRVLSGGYNPAASSQRDIYLYREKLSYDFFCWQECEELGLLIRRVTNSVYSAVTNDSTVFNKICPDFCNIFHIFVFVVGNVHLYKVLNVISDVTVHVIGMRQSNINVLTL